MQIEIHKASMIQKYSCAMGTLVVLFGVNLFLNVVS